MRRGGGKGPEVTSSLRHGKGVEENREFRLQGSVEVSRRPLLREVEHQQNYLRGVQSDPKFFATSESEKDHVLTGRKRKIEEAAKRLDDFDTQQGLKKARPSGPELRSQTSQERLSQMRELETAGHPAEGEDFRSRHPPYRSLSPRAQLEVRRQLELDSVVVASVYKKSPEHESTRPHLSFRPNLREIRQSFDRVGLSQREQATLLQEIGSTPPPLSALDQLDWMFHRGARWRHMLNMDGQLEGERRSRAAERMGPPGPGGVTGAGAGGAGAGTGAGPNQRRQSERQRTTLR